MILTGRYTFFDALRTAMVESIVVKSRSPFRPCEGSRLLSRNSTIWRNVARLIVALFLLRALIPAGFMPDLKALGDGRLEITLCTVEGLKTVTVDESGQPLTDHSPSNSKKTSSSDLCPFGSVLSHSLALPATASVGMPVALAISIIPSGQTLHLLLPAQGPPLGSRAPPAILLA
jgi:hypothetical protein